MDGTHYSISEAGKLVGVESHVLRYWEDELQLKIPRNGKDYRYYTDLHIQLLKKVKELKEKGCGIYLCSNCSVRLRVFEYEIPGIEYFDGTLVSAEEKLAKPNPAIYERLFEKFHLKAEECFFIDDRQDNIDSAKGCGMDGYCFADGNVERLRAYMEEMEIL